MPRVVTSQSPEDASTDPGCRERGALGRSTYSSCSQVPISTLTAQRHPIVKCGCVASKSVLRPPWHRPKFPGQGWQGRALSSSQFLTKDNLPQRKGQVGTEPTLPSPYTL